MRNLNENDKLTISEVDLENEEQLALHIKEIKRLEIRNYFRLNIFKISLLGMLAALNMILALFSHYVLGLFPVFQDFLKLDIGFFSYLIIWLCVNGFYATVMIFPLTWLRLVYTPGNVVGLLSLNLSDFLIMVVFIGLVFVLKVITNKTSEKWYVFRLTIAGFVATIFASVWNIFANFTFIFRLYGDVEGNYNTWPMAGFLFGFNTIKYGLNFILLIALYKPILLAIKKYQT